MTAFFTKVKRVDWILFACMVALSVMGVRFVESAGGARASLVLQNLWIAHAWTAAAGLAICLALAAADFTSPDISPAHSEHGQHYAIECDYCDGGVDYGTGQP